MAKTRKRRIVKTAVRKTGTTTTTGLTAGTLNDALWTALVGVQNDTMTAGRANAISSAARTIVGVERLKLQFHKLTGTVPTETKMLG